jgi:CO/xanthine dehydrogenase Mo-binding subunit
VVKVLKIGSAFDSGKTLNPKMCEAQMEGGAGMGVGCALYEGFIFNAKGELQNKNLHDYKICSAADLPSGKNFSSVTVEYAHPEGPYGAKGISETSMCPTAPAIANAIYNAIGVRLTALPMNPERVWSALNNIEITPELSS